MTIHDTLEELFRTACNDDTIDLTDETKFADLPDWDSVAFINLLFSLEATFGRQFPAEELTGIESVGELKRFLDGLGVGT